MSIGRRIVLALIRIVLGGAIGGGLGLGGGLAYTELAKTSGFEGYSGYVVALWMLGGILAGIVAGLVTSLRFAKRWSIRSRAV